MLPRPGPAQAMAVTATERALCGCRTVPAEQDPAACPAHPPDLPPQSSLDALHTPALMLFVHLLPVALTLWLLAAQGVLELRPLGLRAVHGSMVAAALAGVQVRASGAGGKAG